MSESDKVGLITFGGASDVGLPKVTFNDGPLGIGFDSLLGGRVSSGTAMPAGVALAATFDPGFAKSYGAVVGSELKHRGIDGDYGPTVNIMRTPLGGRTYEAYGEDPYVAARTAVGWIDGLQSQGVMADVKHFAANNQEGQDGVAPAAGAVGGRFFVNAKVDERELQEIEYPAFEAAVQQGHTATVMCAYNQLNGTYACDDSSLLMGDLRRGLGFNGFVVSDAGAAHDPALDLGAGMNVDTVGNADNAIAVNAALVLGRLPQATLDARVHEILRTLFAFGFFDRLAYTVNPAADAQASDDATAVQVEEQGATLLKNDGVLPIAPSRVHSIAVIGPAASHYIRGFGSSQVTPDLRTTALAGIQARAAQDGIRVSYDDGSDPARAAAIARAADLAIVVGADSEAEGADKLCMSLTPQCAPTQQSVDPFDFGVQGVQSAFGDQDGLISAITAANRSTVVVLETGAPVLTPWRAGAAGLLEAWYPGQEGGSAIAHVLFGDADPGGRLPVTFPASAADEPTAVSAASYPGTLGVDQNPGAQTGFGPNLFQESYTEGVLSGYRWFDAHRLPVAYPFGYGLSYASFAIGDLRITPQPGGPGATVSVAVTNTGRRAGEAVPELYLGLPEPSPSIVEPPSQLKGFQKLALAPGQSARASFTVDARAVSYWSDSSSSWQIAPGCVNVTVGSSSRDPAVAGQLAEGGATCATARVGTSGVSSGMSSARECRSRRAVTYQLPRGVHSVRLVVGGRARVAHVHRHAVRVSFYGLPRHAVRVVLSGRRGRRAYRRRSLVHPCQKRLPRRR